MNYYSSNVAEGTSVHYTYIYKYIDSIYGYKYRRGKERE